MDYYYLVSGNLRQFQFLREAENGLNKDEKRCK